MLDSIFKALSDPTRREILKMLRSGDMSAGDIAKRFHLAKSTLSAHFTILKHAGLIVQERRKTTILYSLNISAAEEIATSILSLLSKNSTLSKGNKR